MSVRVEGEVILLVGRCQAEDAEALLVALQESAARIVDLAEVQRMHLAVAQVLLAVRPTVQGSPTNAFLARYFVNLLQ
ncbi:hypothetical protein RZN05_03550 [Sphingomonas sp. HF-S4]|uniref:STAS domain-containing protein n=1 Tax=Sphingomonas agrestis TaxID=3080540 RepID=A0ABU3Y3Z4_9SPHN|nr:hypothetical protein [Sphingomonas sp. HF-S4]MDV3456044.1 hypothetical protein [Sphingomonas sp. HF-S4]